MLNAECCTSATVHPIHRTALSSFLIPHVTDAAPIPSITVEHMQRDEV